MLVGRVAERARIDHFLVSVAERRSGALLLTGEPGAGKTALLTYARERATAIRSLAVRGFEAERDLPYAGLSLLLRPIHRVLDQVPPAQREAVAAALGFAPAVAAERYAVYGGV